MVYPYNMKSLQQWNRGVHKVQIMVPGHDKPVAYCDGTEQDIRDLRATAEEEGTELPEIRRRILKTGREIWTIGEAPPDAFDPDDD